MENHKLNGDVAEIDCCTILSEKDVRRNGFCPTCGIKGLPVKAITIKALTSEQWSDYNKITDGFYCTNPEDSTVYYIPDNNLVINKLDLLVRVGLKEKVEPLLVCYCFQHTRSEIEQDFVKNNHSTIEDEIREKVRKDLCSCEILNPKGRCCLGDVRKTYLKTKVVSIKN